MLFDGINYILGELRESEDKPLASPLLPSVQGCGVEWVSGEDSPWTKYSQDTHSIYESGQPCAAPSTDPEAICHTAIDWGQRLAHSSHPHSTLPLFLFFFFLLFLLCFSFPFPPFTLFPVSLFILVKQIPLTPVPLCFPYYTSLLPLSLSLHQFSWRVSPQGLVLCCRWITENSTSRVRKAGSAGAEDTAQSLCAQTVGKTVSWAWTECHSPEFCPVNLSNFLFQLLWMFREKLELGAVAFRVFPWVIISNLRLQKESRGKWWWGLAKQQRLTYRAKVKADIRLTKNSGSRARPWDGQRALPSGVCSPLFSQVCTLGWCQV